MAEGILVNIIADALTHFGSSSVQQIASACGLTTEFTKLSDMLNIVRGVLVDAEKKQEESDAVNAWVRRLKDVVYDADDLLEDLASHQQQRGGAARQVSDFFSSSNQLAFRLQMSHRINHIKEEVNEIIKEIPILNLIQGNIIQREERSRWRETHSFVLTPEMVGREDDKEKIIKWLVSSGNEKVLSGAAIIGIGGLGKTTLAQLIFNDQRIEDFFQPKIWVCVSDDFDVQLLLKKILKSLRSGENVENSELEVLKDSLHQQLKQKRYLLVLDDVWNDDFQKWDRLRTLLMVGAHGSKMVVTTRNRNVASTMGIDYPFTLEGLNEGQSWDLFSKMAFNNGQERQSQNLVQIGQEIVEMCIGVPLIIKTLGAILRFKTEERQWLSIKNNKNLLQLGAGKNDSALSVLKLSYEDLPFHLRQCFAYCALFPKDHEIKKKMLVQLWMAQGYVRDSDEGNLYFEELLSRSLLEEADRDDYYNISSCQMHDLMHDLARFVAGSEVHVLGDDVKETLERAYHVSFAPGTDINWKDWKVKHLRTILGFDSYKRSSLTSSLQNFKPLRALDLSKALIDKVPKSIAKLGHLRYLDLSDSDLKVLPNAITRLYNLQTLKLNFCTSLKEIPENTRELINLRYLENDGCWNLTGMPCGIGELSLLESLQLFVVGRGSNCGRLRELGRLNSLKGRLSITKLENVKDAKAESVGAKLGEKQHLEYLGLGWSDGEEAESGEDAELVMAGLQPHWNLKEISIKGYGGRGFPNWIMDDGLSCALPNLIRISLRRCSECVILPPFVKLPNLKFLELEDLNKVEYIDRCSPEGSVLSSLEELQLINMPKLKELWRMDLTTASPPSFPRLLNLTIMFCDELQSMELHSSPLLSSLDIRGCPKLTSCLLAASPLLSNLCIQFCSKFTSFKVSSLFCIKKKLILSRVREVVLREIMSSATASSLESLRIEGMDDLISLPDELH